MRFLTLDEVLELHQLVLAQSGGAAGMRDVGALKSAIAQQLMSFGGQEVYPTLADKAVALAFSIIRNHPFVDGNKRVGHAAMETFLVLNGWELSAGVDEQERMVLGLASDGVTREQFTTWVQSHLQRFSA